MLLRGCDRCYQQIIDNDAAARDLIDTEYPHSDLCVDCYLIVTLATTCTVQDTIKRQRSGTALIHWAKSYGINANFKQDEEITHP